MDAATMQELRGALDVIMIVDAGVAPSTGSTGDGR